jgi:type II secretory pathway component GspD/PulD (secretin)
MMKRGMRLTLVLAVHIALGCTLANSQVYCNIQEVKAKALANGVQVSVHADGILDWEAPDRDYSKFYGNQPRSEFIIRFPQARSKLDDNFIDVSVPPVSYIQVYVPQDAELGIGLEMRIILSEPANFDTSRSPDQQTFMISFLSERTVDRGGASTGDEEADTPAKKGTLEVRCEGGLVWVKATNADIHKVVGEVAHQAGINAAVDDAVKHKVSLRLNGLEPLAVLQGIAAGYGLALSEDGDVIMISEGVPRDMATYNRSGTASFPMKYLRAGEAQSLLPTFLFSYLHANMEQNAIVVTAPSQMLEKIERDLNEVDQPPPLIMVEVLAVELTDTKQLSAGLHWLYQGTSDIVGTDPRTGSVEYRIVGPEDFPLLDPENPDAGIVRTRDLAVRLDALVDKGAAKIRANPRMAASNGQEAEIFIGAQRFIKVQFVQRGQQQERIQSVPVGVRLIVTPWTGGNREITTHLVAEVSNIVEVEATTGLPLLSTRRAESTVRAGDSETIVIGGLTQKQEETSKKKIPILGDIPIFGSLFRHKTKTSTNTELVLLITPRILTAEGRLPDAEEEKAIRSKFLETSAEGDVSSAPDGQTTPG